MTTSTTAPAVTASAMLAYIDGSKMRPHSLWTYVGPRTVANARAALMSSIGHQVVDVVLAYVAHPRSREAHLRLDWTLQAMRLQVDCTAGLLVEAALAVLGHPHPGDQTATGAPAAAIRARLKSEYPTSVEPDLVLAWRAA